MAENQVGHSYSFFFRHPLISFGILLSAISFCLSSLLYLSCLTITVLIVSTVVLFFTFSMKRQVLEEVPIQDGVQIMSDQESLPEVENDLKVWPENEVEGAEKDIREVCEVAQILDTTVRSPDVLSESESVDLSSTSDDSCVDWPLPYNVGQDPGGSDDSISDDDSLIEIALPGGRYVDCGSNKLKPSVLLPVMPEFLPESVFGQHGLMDLFSEINEEDNLIEIDISMGSIKCSKLEVEA